MIQDINHNEYSSSTYKLNDGTIIIDNINCQYDEKENKIKDIIDEHILHCEGDDATSIKYIKYSGLCY